jgi:putative addiction module component (TIGR02574 family)
MTLAITLPPPGFDDLPIEAQIEYVQSLWERIAASEEHVPSPAWHHEVVAARRAAFLQDPSAGRPWEEIARDLRRKFDR